MTGKPSICLTWVIQFLLVVFVFAREMMRNHCQYHRRSCMWQVHVEVLLSWLLSHVHKDAELPFDFCIIFNGSAFSLSSGYIGFSAAKILGKPMSIIVAWPLPWSWMISCGSLGILRVIRFPKLSNISLTSWTQFGLRALGFRFGAASFHDCSIDAFSTTLTAVLHGSSIYMLVIYDLLHRLVCNALSRMNLYRRKSTWNENIESLRDICDDKNHLWCQCHQIFPEHALEGVHSLFWKRIAESFPDLGVREACLDVFR